MKKKKNHHKQARSICSKKKRQEKRSSRPRHYTKKIVSEIQELLQARIATVQFALFWSVRPAFQNKFKSIPKHPPSKVSNSVK